MTEDGSGKPWVGVVTLGESLAGKGRGVARVDGPGNLPAPTPTVAVAAVLLPLLPPYVLLGGASMPLGASGVIVVSRPEEVNLVVKVVISWNVFFISCLS